MASTISRALNLLLADIKSWIISIVSSAATSIGHTKLPASLMYVQLQQNAVNHLVTIKNGESLIVLI